MPESVEAGRVSGRFPADEHCRSPAVAQSPDDGSGRLWVYNSSFAFAW